jgi:hypothetical protein
MDVPRAQCIRLVPGWHAACYMRVCVSVSMSVSISVSVSMSLCVNVCVCLSVRVCVCVCMCVGACVSVCVQKESSTRPSRAPEAQRQGSHLNCIVCVRGCAYVRVSVCVCVCMCKCVCKCEKPRALLVHMVFNEAEPRPAALHVLEFSRQMLLHNFPATKGLSTSI